MKKKRLAFVDYWSHQSTRSGDFLREIFLEQFEITDFWWKEKDKIPLEDLNKFDYIFFFHVMFPHQILRRLKNKKLMWAKCMMLLILEILFLGPFFGNKYQI